MFVTRPPAIVKIGTHDGFEDGQTMMSPGSIRPKSSCESVTLAGPRTTPAEAPVPFSESTVLVGRAADRRTGRRSGGSAGILPT